MIYYPRKEHAIIKYGDQEICYAVAIPKGEGRYVLDRVSGAVKIISGPRMYLPDPRKEVVTGRILSQRECALFYPGNREAAEFNQALADKHREVTPQALAESMTNLLVSRNKQNEMLTSRGLTEKFGGDSFERKSEYTPPRTVILNSKYLGTVGIKIWTGYAVKVVSTDGKGRVIVGPDAVMLEYDETLEPMSLSTGTPKSADRLIETDYLKVKGNKVSDIIQKAQTSDMVEVSVRLGYRVDFDGDDPLKWFAVENYVGFLTEHCRSVLISTIKKFKVADLHARSTEILRDAILGRKPEIDKGGDRPGMIFKENNMRIYDVEILEVTIGSREVQSLLVEAEMKSIRSNLTISQRKQEVAATKIIEGLNRDELEEKRTTEEAIHEASLARIEENKDRQTAEIESKQELALQETKHKHLLETENTDQLIVLEKKRIDGDKVVAGIEDEIAKIRRAMQTADWKVEEAHEGSMVKLVIEALAGRAEHAKKIGEAFSPELIVALNSLRDEKILASLGANFKDLAVLEGQGILATASRFLDVLPEDFLKSVKEMFAKAPGVTKKAVEEEKKN